MANSQLSLVRYAPGVEARDYGLRWYQHEAKAAVERDLESARGTLVVMATGLGKTTLFGAIAGDWPGDVLVLAHRDELVQQAALRLEAMTGETVEVEQGPMHASANARIVVASVQTMMRESRLSGFAPDRFGLIIVDEVHHYVSPSFRRPLDYFRNAKVLGVTATPDRADGHALGKIVDSVAYSLDIVDGIEGGYLVPLVGQQVVLGQINLSGIKTQAGDLVAGQLDEEIVKACGAIVQRTLELYPDRKGPVFFPGVKSADLATRLFNAARPGCAEFVSGKTDDDERRDIMRRVKAGRVQFLCNVGIATEGFDWPDADIVVLGRPTKSRSLYTQMVGRGTRVLPGLVEGFAGRDGSTARRAAIAGSAKRDCVILDFTGEAGKHSLVGPEDVLGGRYTDAERDLAKKKRRERRGAMNALDALEEARRELAAAAKALKVRVESTVSAFDPFALYGINREAVRASAMRFGFVEATQGQRDLLRKRGFDVEALAGLSKQEASKLISTEFVRAEKGLATMNQMKALKRHGVHFPVNISKAKASAALDYLASCRWRGWDAGKMAEIVRG